MRIRYDATTKTLNHKDGSREDFYCGSVLDNLSLVLLDYRDGSLSTQQAYSELLKLIVTQELSTKTVEHKPVDAAKVIEKLYSFKGGLNGLS